MKYYYSQGRQRYEVAEWRAEQGMVVIDHDTDGDALGVRWGFIGDDEEDLVLVPVLNESIDEQFLDSWAEV